MKKKCYIIMTMVGLFAAGFIISGGVLAIRYGGEYFEIGGFCGGMCVAMAYILVIWTNVSRYAVLITVGEWIIAIALLITEGPTVVLNWKWVNTISVIASFAGALIALHQVKKLLKESDEIDDE